MNAASLFPTSNAATLPVVPTVTCAKCGARWNAKSLTVQDGRCGECWAPFDPESIRSARQMCGPVFDTK